MEFEGQQSDEKVINVYKKHWSVLLSKIILILVLAIILLVVVNLKLHIVIDYFVGFWLLISRIWLALALIPWAFTYYILTDQRLRYVNQKGIFKKAILDINFDQIEHVEFLTNNFIQDLTNTSTVIIQTETGDLTIKKLQHANNFYNDLQNQITKGKQDDI